MPTAHSQSAPVPTGGGRGEASRWVIEGLDPSRLVTRRCKVVWLLEEMGGPEGGALLLALHLSLRIHLQHAPPLVRSVCQKKAMHVNKACIGLPGWSFLGFNRHLCVVACGLNILNIFVNIVAVWPEGYADKARRRDNKWADCALEDVLDFICSCLIKLSNCGLKLSKVGDLNIKKEDVGKVSNLGIVGDEKTAALKFWWQRVGWRRNKAQGGEVVYGQWCYVEVTGILSIHYEWL